MWLIGQNKKKRVASSIFLEIKKKKKNLPASSVCQKSGPRNFYIFFLALVNSHFLNKYPDHSTITITNIRLNREFESLTMNVCMLCAIPKLWRYKICLKTVPDDNYTRTESNTKSITWLRLYTRTCKIALNTQSLVQLTPFVKLSITG